MLEIFAVVMLCKVNSKNAKARGRRPGGFIALTIILWVVFEILGIVASALLFDDFDVGILLIALPCAALGGLISFLIAKNCSQGDYVDPNAVPVPVVTYGPNGAPVYTNPATPAYMVNQVPVQPVQPMQPIAQPVGDPSAVRYCKYCGSPNSRASNFCENCGHVFE